MVGPPAYIEAAVGIVVIVGTVGGAYHKFVVVPARTKADKAMSKARAAETTATSAEDTAEEVADRVDDRLSEIRDTLEEIREAQIEQAREGRGRSYTLSRFAEALRDAEGVDANKIPDVDPDEFVRGDGGRPREEDDE